MGDLHSPWPVVLVQSILIHYVDVPSLKKKKSWYFQVHGEATALERMLCTHVPEPLTNPARRQVGQDRDNGTTD
jgi:hypothetical protein